MPPSPLPPDSYTARRLEHATPEHLHLTSIRTFIGPIPEGWLKSHKKEWYRKYVGTSRRPTFTAAQPLLDGQDESTLHPDPVTAQGEQQPDQELPPIPESEPQPPRPSSQSRETGLGEMRVTSTTSLLHSQRASMAEQSTQPAFESYRTAPETLIHSVQAPNDSPAPGANTARVRFNESSRLQLRARAQRLAARGGFRTSKVKDGEIMKIDKMLVRIDITQQHIRGDYDEKASQGVESRMLDKWREFMVVARKHTEDDATVILQLYKTRVISAGEGDSVKNKPKAQILLSQSRANANLYSSLDKTLCVWTNENARTTLYYLRPMSSAMAVEWFNFLQTALGHKRAQSLQISVPDLSVNLRLDDPFGSTEVAKTLAEAAAGDDNALARAIAQESGAASAIVSRCVEMLQESPEWVDILKAWSQSGRIGLAWKRYDRLEWVHGAVEQKMYGTIAMQKTHELELRPKDHYPMTIKVRGEQKILQEPQPVEGFLIRLTSQKGQDRRLGKMLYKRLYFTSYNHYLVFLRPARAVPPRPPKAAPQQNGDLPSAKQLAHEIPLIFSVNPYPTVDGKITWLDDKALPGTEIIARDRDAAGEADRNTDMLLGSDGFVDVCDIRLVRRMQKGAVPADENLEDGEDVNFHVDEPEDGVRTDDGATTEVDEDRTFELVLKNGLIIRLQAFNKAACAHWINRMQDLVEYWSRRAKADMDLYKSVREQNLHELNIDERAEAVVGQYANKWEVSHSFASSSVYHMCGISNCRTIHLSGLLFRKPRRHTTFTRCHVILSHGHLLVFQDTVRKRTGAKLVHIHHERIASIDLKGCYLYSGLLTENDLLYQNQTFDSNTPGHNALPRIYLEDGWTSTDEDAMTTFVIWHSKSKSWFRSSQNVDDVRESERDAERSEGGTRAKTQTKLKRVSQLGATGRSVVFKARSRAERDHWVLAIQNEIERLASQEQVDDVRVVKG